jgi:hypothetical protein
MRKMLVTKVKNIKDQKKQKNMLASLGMKSWVSLHFMGGA